MSSEPEKRKIVTSYVNPPIPTRQFDWCAHFEGEEEAGGYGYGATEAEAIQDFIGNRDESVGAFPIEAKPMVFLLSADEGVLFDPQDKFHGWIMRRHPDGMWVSVRKLDAIDPEDHPLIRAMKGKPSPLTMLCDMRADGSCESAGSDFCEFECPNRRTDR